MASQPTAQSASATLGWVSPLLADVFQHQIIPYLRKVDRGVVRRVCTQWRDALPLDEVVLTSKWLSDDPQSLYSALKHTESFVSRLNGDFPSDILAKAQRGGLFDHLRSFSLSGNPLSDYALKEVISALLNCRQLTSLDLDNSQFGEWAYSALSRLIYNSKALKTLKVQLTHGKPDHRQLAFDALERISSLENLHLRALPMDDRCIRSLSLMLENNPRIQTLEFCGGIGAKAAPLFHQLSKNRSVFNLTVSASVMDSPPVYLALSEAIKSRSSVLKHLELHGCRIQPDAAAALGAALCSNSSITSFTTSNNPIGDQGLIGISTALESSTCGLKILKVLHPKCGSAGIKALASAIQRNKNLVELEIGYMDVACEPLGSAVGSSVSLRDVSVVSCDFGELGISDLARNLARNTSLISLNLNNAEMTVASGTALGNALSVNTTLQSLFITPNHVSPFSATRGILEGLQKNQHLRKLSLTGDMDGRTRDALIQAIDKNTSLKDLYVKPAGFVAVQSHAFFVALLENTASSLDTIYLDSCETTWGAARRFADVLRAPSSNLRSVTLRACFNSDSEIKDVAEALAVNQKLTSLDISKGMLGSQGAKYFAQAIRTNTVLQNLNLSYHNIDESGLVAFKEIADSTAEKKGLTVHFDGNSQPLLGQCDTSKLHM